MFLIATFLLQLTLEDGRPSCHSVVISPFMPNAANTRGLLRGMKQTITQWKTKHR